MSIEFEKFHGTGNDFVVVDADEYVPDRGAFAREVCDRRDGVRLTDGGAAAEQGKSSESVGADGTLFLALEPNFSPPRAVMTLVQPDGSTAAMCGNGARCAAKWAAERTGADTVMLDTQAGTRRAEIADDEVTIEMGAPSFAPEEVPLAADREEPLLEETIEGVELTAVNTGVPHGVAFVEDVDEVALDAVAPAVRRADVFPDGANVTFASRRDEGDSAETATFDQRTYERGVEGETRACGTGAVAIAAVARRLGEVEEDAESVAVFPPGGRLGVAFDGERASLTGPAEREFEGEIASTPEPRRLSEA
ncbi:diaminopimelate epimerase [Halorussus pelagicus]|uniref:diaminopimelate epimerase n=1 Tax=Halorussus pelagicus TaxID=2505977 RepID=UPI000FFBF3FA|nr:diaminopimelate epimerase [Halorussus pelagicus]